MLHYPTDRDPVDSIIQSSNKWSLLNSFIYLSFCLSTNVYSWISSRPIFDLCSKSRLGCSPRFFRVLTYKIFFLHTYQSRLGGVFEEFSFGVQQPEGVMAFLVNETWSSCTPLLRNSIKRNKQHRSSHLFFFRQQRIYGPTQQPGYRGTEKKSFRINSILFFSFFFFLISRQDI